MSDHKTFAVVYQPGTNWNPAVPFHEQSGVGRHRDFLAAQHDAGRLIIGGPFLDDAGGLAVYRAGSREDLDAILAQDDTVKDGLLCYQLHPYLIAFAK